MWTYRLIVCPQQLQLKYLWKALYGKFASLAGYISLLINPAEEGIYSQAIRTIWPSVNL